ncbi:MAG: nitrous oxide reductase family maturation protein NosD [Burkholderiales bacterium]|jgi:nitrous oxidase accessory protein|nr:nitrous oxide reductase family maturation protein NosD [Burkholderiales bacterium]MBP7522318.1 nitrous oxide reductase family maturation protein NosD [Leptothrix sp. (in: b-proteobacteria)]
MTQRRVVRSLVRAAWLACAGLALTAAAQLAPFGAGEQPTETAGQSDAPRVSAADLSTAPRVDVDKPVELIPLYLRDKRIHGFKPLQELIDAAPEGGVLNIPSGRYAGPVHLKKPLTLVGQGEVVVDGGDKGTVFVVETNGATLRHLTITGSGDSHDSDDGCLNVRGHRNTIEDVTIADCLFGIDLKQSHDNLLRGNRVRSKAADLGVRGDGIRLWYSHRNRIENNLVTDSRDMVAWYSNDNLYLGNEGRRSRYSIHFMFANRNIVEHNRFIDNAVGVYFMYCEGGGARHNLISHATGATGMALGFKEASDIFIEDNEIIYSAIGVGSDISPFQPNTTIRFLRNRFAYNGIAVQLTSELGGNVFADNLFEGNLTDIFRAGKDSGYANRWAGNWFDTYQGFDRNADGIGDKPHEHFAYADQIWMEFPAARFFKTSPVLELLDFLERLAPFSSPDLQLRDEQPRLHRPDLATGQRSAS